MFAHVSPRLTVNLPLLLEELVMIEWEVHFPGDSGNPYAVFTLVNCPTLTLPQEEGRLLWQSLQTYIARLRLAKDRPIGLAGPSVAPSKPHPKD